MALTHVAPNIDPADFVVIPHVACLDEFRMTNPDGSFVCNVTPEFLTRLCAHMTEREQTTGDLSPIVIGHTQDGLPEIEQPTVVGFARNWHIAELGTTGRQCAFADFWIRRDCVDLARKFPRRSCEVWSSRYEVDPISLLGATTPARDLGLMKLSRDGSQIVNSPGDMIMPDEKDKDKKPVAADPKESGDAKGKDGKLDQILALLTQLLEKMGGDTAGAGAPTPATATTPATPGAPAPAGGDQPMSDEDYNALMQELMGQGGAGGEPKPDESRAGEPKTKNEGAYVAPGQSDTVVPGQKAKMSRQDQEIADLRAQVTRMDVKDRLVKLARPDVAPADDAAFIEDLVAMPPEIRERTIVRLGRAPTPPGNSTLLGRALDGAVAHAGGRKLMTREDAAKFSRIASERQAKGEKVSFEQIAAENGFDLKNN